MGGGKKKEKKAEEATSETDVLFRTLKPWRLKSRRHLFVGLTMTPPMTAPSATSLSVCPRRLPLFAFKSLTLPDISSFLRAYPTAFTTSTQLTERQKFKKKKIQKLACKEKTDPSEKKKKKFFWGGTKMASTGKGC